MSTETGNRHLIFERVEELTAQRDRARDVAVALHGQVALVENLHIREEAAITDDVGDPAVMAFCPECTRLAASYFVAYPCTTARALFPTDDEEGDRNDLDCDSPLDHCPDSEDREDRA